MLLFWLRRFVVVLGRFLVVLDRFLVGLRRFDGLLCGPRLLLVANLPKIGHRQSAQDWPSNVTPFGTVRFLDHATSKDFKIPRTSGARA